jgi:SAM-dependent methyltransferase
MTQSGMKDFLPFVESFHSGWISRRRVGVLSTILSELIPNSSTVLDIGCGDGRVGHLIQQKEPSIEVRGLEVMARPGCLLECRAFDGKKIPYDDGSFDVCMFVDVLHHTREVRSILEEACRVSRGWVIIKDHLCESSFDHWTLRLMDWVGNRPRGVQLTYNYLSRAQWMECFAACGLRVITWQDEIPLHGFPFLLLFSRGLHFVALLRRAQFQRA